MTAPGRSSRAQMRAQLEVTSLPLRGMRLVIGLVDQVQPVPVEDAIRPLLDLLHRVAGLDASYVTTIARHGDEHPPQPGETESLDATEEGVIRWAEDLCRQALEDGPRYLTEVPKTHPSDPVEQIFGTTYAMHPIVSGNQREVVGMLCAVSSTHDPIGADHRRILDMVADVIGHQVVVERAREVRESSTPWTDQRIHERARFLAIAQHKLKTPLTVIRGWAHFLKSQRETTITEMELDEGIEAISRNAGSLAQLVDELLEEASLDAHAREINEHLQDLGSFLEAVAAEFDGVSRDHPVVADVTSPLEAWFDGPALHQALGHLLLNAVKYSPSGGRIVIRARPDGDRVLIEIEDRGAGIPPGLDLFAPFTRGDESVPGAGLGLHIARMIIESMDGSIHAHRNEGGPGSTFSIHLKGGGEPTQGGSAEIR
jgi:signal transduction histidine kinase